MREVCYRSYPRHEVLRTVLREHQGQPYQVVMDIPDKVLQVYDGSVIEGSGKSVQEFVAEESIRPFDLANDLLLRAFLIELSRTEHVLLLVMHHISSDGWSAETFMRELSNTLQVS